jgi:putative FmdB family regulatory protein
MPTYEYACKECGEHLEVVQSFKDDPLTECPTCHGQLRKVFSAAGLIFKGSGWHIKDYSSSARSSAPTSGGDAPASDKATATGGDTSGSSSDAPSTGGSGEGSASSSSGKASEKPSTPAASSTEKKSA